MPTAGAFLAVGELFPADEDHVQLSLPFAQCELDTFGETNALRCSQRDAIDDQRDGVLELLVERGRLVQQMAFAVDDHPQESA